MLCFDERCVSDESHAGECPVLMAITVECSAIALALQAVVANEATHHECTQRSFLEKAQHLCCLCISKPLRSFRRGGCKRESCARFFLIEVCRFRCHLTPSSLDLRRLPRPRSVTQT